MRKVSPFLSSVAIMAVLILGQRLFLADFIRTQTVRDQR